MDVLLEEIKRVVAETNEFQLRDKSNKLEFFGVFGLPRF